MKGTKILLNFLQKLMINSHLVEECRVIHFKILLTPILIIIKMNKTISKFMMNQNRIHSIIKDKEVIIKRVILMIIKK
jgi:hypothetical protein